MAYNRYQGNTGRVTRIPEPAALHTPARGGQPLSRTPVPEPQMKRRPAGPFQDIQNSLGGILSKLGHLELETEDLLLCLILYLAYRESGDKELLIILGAMLFL